MKKDNEEGQQKRAKILKGTTKENKVTGKISIKMLI
jgi:hypothetical protein